MRIKSSADFFFGKLGIKPGAAGSGSKYVNHRVMLPTPTTRGFFALSIAKSLSNLVEKTFHRNKVWAEQQRIGKTVKTKNNLFDFIGLRRIDYFQLSTLLPPIALKLETAIYFSIRCCQRTSICLLPKLFGSNEKMTLDEICIFCLKWSHFHILWFILFIGGWLDH